VVVAVEDPYGLRTEAADGRPELSLGLFVEVELYGATLPAVFPVPRGALRGGDEVWLVDDDARLQIRPVEVARRERETVLVAAGLQRGERLVLTPLSGAAAGMELRPVEVMSAPQIGDPGEVGR
jgi:hypothetical protein